MRITTPKNGIFDHREQNTIILQADQGEKFKVSILEQDIIRIQHLPFGKESLDRTWMILGSNTDPDYDIPFEGRQKEDYSVFSLPPFKSQIDPKNVLLQTSALKLNIRINDFHLTWTTASNLTFAADREISAYPYDQENHSVFHYLQRDNDDLFYGFGERSGPINKKGRRMRMFNMDALGYNAESGDPLYKHFPVYITYNPRLNIAYGLIYDNLSTTIFDMGCEIDNYHPPYRYYQAEQGEIDYYFIYGPSITEVVKKIALLTGKMALPPKWSLGYLGSSMAYTDAPDAQNQLGNFRDQCSKHKIPCDMFHLSSGYSMSDEGKRYVFVWNNNRVPNPKKLAEDFHQNGIKLAANIKPALLNSHPDYALLSKEKAFIQKADQNLEETVLFWGGFAAHLDFTNPLTITWWKNKVTHNLLDFGIDGTWNDNNEYPITDDSAQCFGFGKPIRLGLIRPIQPLLMTRTSRSAQLDYKPNSRPYVLCRSGCPGIQRYAQTWSGDNRTSWNTLKYNIPMGLGMSLSGAPNTGHDVGGFAGEKPDPELFVRWVQNGIFHPRFTIHSWNDDGTVNEPWMYPEIIGIIRELINFRYRLIPYLYSLFFEAARDGIPIIRPMVYHFPNDPNCWEESFDFMLGDNLLVASVLEPGVLSRDVYLPSGNDWCDFWSGRWFEGGQKITVDAPLNKIPLFVRDGGIIPMGKSMQFIGEQEDSERTIYLFPHPTKGIGKFSLIEDDGISLNYQNNLFSEIELVINSDVETIQFFMKLLKNNFELPYQEINLILPENENRAFIFNGRYSEKVINHQRRIRISLQ